MVIVSLKRPSQVTPSPPLTLCSFLTLTLTLCLYLVTFYNPSPMLVSIVLSGIDDGCEVSLSGDTEALTQHPRSKNFKLYESCDRKSDCKCKLRIKEVFLGTQYYTHRWYVGDTDSS